MLDLIEQYITRHSLLQRGKPCLVALSGGADSVALLRVLLQLGYDVHAAHCNFNLRGEESQRDEQFCVSLCQQLNVQLHRAHFDTRQYAELHHQSIELAARNLRYAWFEQLRRDIGAQAVCVAHHRDDSVETVLMNLVRGTGISGLTGIKPHRDHIVRPLLCVSRQQILSYLSALGQPYVTDSTNLQADEATRNRIRLEVMPLLEQVNPRAADNIMRAAEHLAQAKKMLNSMADALLPADGEGLDVDTLTDDNATYVLHRWLSPCGFSSAQVEDIARHRHGQSGTLWQTATHQLLLHRGRLLLEPVAAPMPPLRIPEEGHYRLPGGAEDCIHINNINVEPGFQPSRNPQEATLDADMMAFPLTLRPCQTGDRFQPLGMKGTRLVSDLLTDRHMSLFDKQRQLILADNTDRIVWLPGLMPCHHCRITEQTRRVMQIRFE